MIVIIWCFFVLSLNWKYDSPGTCLLLGDETILRENHYFKTGVRNQRNWWPRTHFIPYAADLVLGTISQIC